jgi:hypothetical protein
MDQAAKGHDLPRPLDDGLFDLIGYLLTSARGLLDEPPEYGPFRLIEGVSRLCGLMSTSSRRRELLGRLKLVIDGDKLTVMTDAKAFKGLLDNAVLEFTRGMKAEGETHEQLE